MNESSMNVDQRLHRLENENRLLKRIGVVVTFVFGLLLILSTNLVRSPGVLQAERVEIQDAEGRTRAALGLDASGFPFLDLKDHLGKQQIFLGVAADNTPGLSFRTNGRLRMSLNAYSTGESHVDLYSTDQMLAASLFSTPESRSGLNLRQWADSYTMAMGPGGKPSLSYLKHRAQPVEIVNLPTLPETTAQLDEPIPVESDAPLPTDLRTRFSEPRPTIRNRKMP